MGVEAQSHAVPSSKKINVSSSFSGRFQLRRLPVAALPLAACNSTVARDQLHHSPVARGGTPSPACVPFPCRSTVGARHLQLPRSIVSSFLVRSARAWSTLPWFPLTWVEGHGAWWPSPAICLCGGRSRPWPLPDLEQGKERACPGILWKRKERTRKKSEGIRLLTSGAWSHHVHVCVRWLT